GARENAWFTSLSKQTLFLRRRILPTFERHLTDDAFALFHVDQFVHGEVLQRVHHAARPANFEQVHFLRLPETEMYSQVVLRKEASAAAHFINLLMRPGFAGHFDYATQAGANAAAVGFSSNRANLYPGVVERGIAADELRQIVHTVHNEINVAVIVEISERTAARRGRHGNSRAC